ncbi:uncharacterized protein BO80DRAFT_70495 [Aspergillus ibericus CBS 121593]|uniref:Uncharacterized protein n=1 Tax=Aspergillus ibericus CBS 121593 TaxID=1448316 RepID=A0A395H1N3_9EURO|nr:hypothetical protein BO80DRAFT_70495 [Aspergillus ibericus CBS 121593]RAL01125.1 hypothetical protein BO80DRAFT_70495 [Aspergillus ibericus CBS 121593]
MANKRRVRWDDPIIHGPTLSDPSRSTCASKGIIGHPTNMALGKDDLDWIDERLRVFRIFEQLCREAHPPSPSSEVISPSEMLLGEDDLLQMNDKLETYERQEHDELLRICEEAFNDRSIVTGCTSTTCVGTCPALLRTCQSWDSHQAPHYMDQLCEEAFNSRALIACTSAFSWGRTCLVCYTHCTESPIGSERASDGISTEENTNYRIILTNFANNSTVGPW